MFTETLRAAADWPGSAVFNQSAAMAGATHEPDVIKWQDETLTVTNCDKLKTDFDSVAARKNNVILDLVEVNFLDSSGLGALLSIKRKSNNLQQELYLVIKSKSVLALIELIRMNKILDIYPSVEDAVEALQAG